MVQYLLEILYISVIKQLPFFSTKFVMCVALSTKFVLRMVLPLSFFGELRYL